MKKALNLLIAVAILATVTFAANMENPLYTPAQFDFYSKTGFSFMYKQSDANLAMKAKNWEYRNEYILRGYEDFGFGLTDRSFLRGAFGYTHDFSIERSGLHNGRLGLGYRIINQPVEAVVWDIYADAWLGGISKMKANLVASTSKLKEIRDSMPLSFKYDNYANGRWGVWLGTAVGKTFDRVTVSAFGEFQKTYGNSNNKIKIDSTAKPVIGELVKNSVISSTCEGLAKAGAVNEQFCKENPGSVPYRSAGSVVVSVNDLASGIAPNYVDSLPEDFKVKTKGTLDYVAGLKALYEIDKDWSMGGGFTWRHRGANSVEKVNITNTSEFPDAATVAKITEKIGDRFKGSMEDGVEEYTIALLGSRRLADNLQLTFFGEFTFDTAEDKAQLGSDIRAELGLRLGWQF